MLAVKIVDVGLEIIFQFLGVGIYSTMEEALFHSMQSQKTVTWIFRSQGSLIPINCVGSPGVGSLIELRSVARAMQIWVPWPDRTPEDDG